MGNIVRCYRTFKNNFQNEPYLKVKKEKNTLDQRKTLTRLEVGRYIVTDVGNILCIQCTSGEVEDEKKCKIDDAPR